MNWYISIVVIFGLIVYFFKSEIEKYPKLKITKAYVSIIVFVFLALGLISITKDEQYSLSSIIINLISLAFFLFIIVRNTNAFVKSFRFAVHKENLHIAIANILQNAIAFAVIYYYIYLYIPNSFKLLVSCSNDLELFLNFIYFSIVTLATVGYGDIVPLSFIAKGCVILEVALFFIVIVITITYISININRKNNRYEQNKKKNIWRKYKWRKP